MSESCVLVFVSVVEELERCSALVVVAADNLAVSWNHDPLLSDFSFAVAVRRGVRFSTRGGRGGRGRGGADAGGGGGGDSMDTSAGGYLLGISLKKL